MEELIQILFPYLAFSESGTLQSIWDLTSIWVAGLHLLFVIFFFYLIIKSSIVKYSIQKVLKNFSEITIHQNKYLCDAWGSYEQHFVVLDSENSKTDDFAEQYFGQASIEKTFNVELWKSIPGIFVGFGILGTFAGLCIGISHLNFSSPEEIFNSIPALLDGIKTAFLTSLHGIFFSIFFGYFEKLEFNSIENAFLKICFLLNKKYKLTKNEKIESLRKEQNNLLQNIEDSANNRQHLIQLTIKEEFNKLHENSTTKLKGLLVFQDANGNEILPSSVFRDLLRESEEQSKALKSFSTDLADVIMDKIETMSTQSIFPLFEDIINSLKTLETSIESFSSSTGQDIGNKLNEAISSLEINLKSIVEDFREAFSSGAMQQLNIVVAALNDSAKAIENFPPTINSILSKITETHAAESQKRENEFSQEIDLTIKKFQGVTNNLIDNLERTSELQIQREKEHSAKIDESILKNQQHISSETEHSLKMFKASIDSILDNLSKAEEKQIKREQDFLQIINGNLADSTRQIEDMILIQESYTKGLKELLSSSQNIINDGSALLSEINRNNETMVKISDSLNSTSTALSKNTEVIDKTTDLLESSVRSLSDQFTSMTQFNDKFLEQIGESLTENQDILKDYVTQFDTIKNGLNEIFNEIEKGLISYSKALKEGVNNSLAGFTNQLSTASNKLAGSIELLNDFFEEISDKIDQIK